MNQFQAVLLQTREHLKDSVEMKHFSVRGYMVTNRYLSFKRTLVDLICECKTNSNLFVFHIAVEDGCQLLVPVDRLFLVS